MPNFDRKKVKGLVCRMFRVKDPKFAQALESAAGGKVQENSSKDTTVGF